MEELERINEAQLEYSYNSNSKDLSKNEKTLFSPVLPFKVAPLEFSLVYNTVTTEINYKILEATKLILLSFGFSKFRRPCIWDEMSPKHLASQHLEELKIGMGGYNYICVCVLPLP